MFLRLITVVAGAAIASGMILVSAPASADVAPLAHCSRTVRVATQVNIPANIPASGSTAASTNCTMGQGSNSSAVRALQLTLLECYGKNIAIDSDFGSNTARALREVQRQLGIADDGVYGSQTRNALFHSTTGNWCSPIVQPPRLG